MLLGVQSKTGCAGLKFGVTNSTFNNELHTQQQHVPLRRQSGSSMLALLLLLTAYHTMLTVKPAHHQM